MKNQKPNNYLLVLTELENAISESNIDGFKKISNSIDSSDEENQITLKDYYENANNPIRNANLVILSSKHNQVQILEYLFSSDSNILNKLSVGIGRPTILPNDKDETHHNAFYYAIRSGNVELIDILINKWPDNYFDDYLEQLDEMLSKAYEELKLKNVPLSDEMEIFVEKKLIKLRFYSNASRNDHGFIDDLNNTYKRIEFVLQNINLLKKDYSNAEEVDEKFVFITKFIALNIHTLKRQLKSSYIRLPWEEIEFFLVCFVSSYTQWKEINLYYRAVLDKSKILNHLENFAKKLEDEINIIKGMNISELFHIPRLNRERVVAEIISNHPPFEELYKDYRHIKDIHSLEKISVNIKLAISADPKERNGQLIITRVLQVIGEYLKNSLESPNLSNTTSELFLLSLPKNARKVIIDLRNSLSHANSLSKRLEIEENRGVNFFINVQNDTKKVGDVVTDILYRNKMKTIVILLKKLIASENLHEIIDVTEVFSTVELEEMVTENFKMLEHQKLENLFHELSDKITDKTNYEMELLNKMNSIISGAGTPSQNIKTDYITGLASLKVLSMGLRDNKIDHTVIKAIKFRANLILKIIAPKIEPHKLNEIAPLAKKISISVESRIISQDQLDDINRALCEIFYIVEFGTDDIKWIEELKKKLNEKGPVVPQHKPRKSYNLTEEQYNNLLVRKLSELKSILSKNFLSKSLMEDLAFYKGDRKLQAVVEMLVLDIMSILGTSKNYLENNVLCLDDYTPLLIGKCLRNHLAHDNTLVDVLLSDPSLSIILNAIMLTEENIINSEKKIGKLVSNDTLKMKEKYDKSLATITDQKRMFVALEEGNLQILKCCVKRGTDIYARNINLWTTLHFAAKGPSLDIVKYVLKKNMTVKVKDINDQTPLHTAAAHGRQNITEFFVKEAGLYVNERSNTGKTPLHVAAQHGHKDTVEVLLKNNANTVVQDVSGFSPLHYAIINNHIDVAQILLEKDVNVNINQAIGGFTPLHAASESGHLEIVNFLLQNKANVNAKDDRNWTPLHAAAYNGYREIVNALILKGADVNARVINGCTPLYYAVENGDEKIVNILLNHEANVNAVEKTHTFTPLHYATKNGQEEIVKVLLKNKAKANAATAEAITPLHFAVQSGHLKIVDVLLKHGVDIHVKDKNNTTPFHYAAENGHKEVAELLIMNGAKINAGGNNNVTPLHLTALNGHKGVTDVLIKNKALVNALDIQGNTPLHAAAVNGSKDIIDLLIKNNAEVNAKNGVGVTPLHVAAAKGHSGAITLLIEHKGVVNAKADNGITPLHAAVLGDHKDVVNLLIKNKAVVDLADVKNTTPLQLAVEASFKEIVEILVSNGANVNVISNDVTPLISAIKCNNKEIVEVLIANGAQVNVECNKPLSIAILAGFRDIVEILLKHTADVNMKGPRNITQLHIAAKRGHKEIVNALIARGADIDTITDINDTPLSYGAQEGHEEVVEILLAAGANINGNGDFTPLHMAAANGHSDVVKVLLDNKAKVDVKDNKNRTPLEMAVSYGHLEVVKIFLQYEKVDMEVKGNDGWTILHIASQESNLELVKYLVDEGSDINARNASGSKPIHIAAREGHKDTVEYFLSKGLRINDFGEAKKTLLHYAAMKGHLEVAKYLIAQGSDVNAADIYGQTPMFIAAAFGYKNITELLLKHGAVYNDVDKFSKGPAEFSNDKDVVNLLSSTEKLFKAVKCNNPSEVENCIQAGAFVNAKNSEGVAPLHYAAWKGYDEVVNILLRNKANPNVVGKQGLTALHYASKFSRSRIINALLTNGAVYNAVSDCSKTPSYFSGDKNVTSFFNLLGEYFKNVENDNSQVIHDLNKIKDIDTIKAIMNARNEENKTLIVAAMQNDFSKIQELKEITQGDISAQINKGSVLLNQGNYQMALRIYQNAFEKRKEILGSDNPATLDILSCIAYALYAQGNYQEALNTYEDIFRKQKEMLGLNYKDTLSTRSSIALVLHRQGKDDAAFSIYQEVYEKQKEILGPNALDTLDTQFHMALVLNRLGKYEEALNINRSVYEKRKKMSGANDPSVVRAQNNIAMVLASQGNYEEALIIYKEVLEKKKVVLGINHSDTLRTFHNIAGVLGNQKKYQEALKAHEEILNIQENVLGVNHPDTLTTRYNMGNVLFAQGKWIGAFKAFRESFDQMKTIFGPNHSSILDILEKLKVLDLMFKVQGTETSVILQHLQKDINIAAINGDIQAVQHLLKLGIDVNDRDIDGRTPLHFAVSNGHIGFINILLKHGADITQATNKGNTPLHTATSKGSTEIVEILLQHLISCNTLNNFINAKTASSGATSLHIAAKNGSLEITKSLLKRGAIYDIKNNESKTPLDLCKEQEVNNLLRLLEELFEDAKNGNIKIIEKLRAIKPDELIAVTEARNNERNTIFQVASANKHKNIANKLLEMLKMSDQNLQKSL